MLELLIGIGSAAAGSLITVVYQRFSGRLQKMKCVYLEDDVLSKIPQRNADGDVTQNLHRKHFRLTNTTNIDVEMFKVVFQFDETSYIKESYSQSKEGANYHSIEKNRRLPNQADATIRRSKKIKVCIIKYGVNQYVAATKYVMITDSMILFMQTQKTQ